ncbi:MAG TPA: HD domain-containing protein [Fimbriimonas sp.]|nr:HD domain-containing protein [Fimbriimonas sp.]
MADQPLDHLTNALAFCINAHQGQFRDGNAALPYATHPIDVCNIMRYVGGVEDQTLLCAALLHDVLEESDVTHHELAQHFGEEVAELVSQVTRFEPDTTGLSEDERYQLRTKLFLEEIEKMSERAHVIKLADRLSNLQQARVTRPKKKLARYIDQTKLILEIIPRTVNPALWDAVQAETKKKG